MDGRVRTPDTTVFNKIRRLVRHHAHLGPELVKGLVGELEPIPKFTDAAKQTLILRKISGGIFSAFVAVSKSLEMILEPDRELLSSEAVLVFSDDGEPDRS